jgi:hypothetical protein
MKSKALLVLILVSLMTACTDTTSALSDGQQEGGEIELLGSDMVRTLVVIDPVTKCEYLISRPGGLEGLASTPRMSADGKTVRGCKDSTPSP